MTRSRFMNVLIAALITLLPLAGALPRLLHPGPLLAFLAACVILLTQPPIGPKTMVKDRGDRFTALAIFAGVIGSQVAALIQFGYRATLQPPLTSLWVLAGAILVAGGLALRVWSIRTLGRFFTSTVRVQQGQKVVQAGPYRILRHPSYTGTMVTCLGASIALGSAVGAVLVLLLVLPAYLFRIAVEERTMIAGIGEEYRLYREHTWRLVPWIL